MRGEGDGVEWGWSAEVGCLERWERSVGGAIAGMTHGLLGERE